MFFTNEKSLVTILQSKDFFEQPQEVKAEKWMNTDQVGYDYKESLYIVHLPTNLTAT